jgi:DNA-binding GntR family transcriptional regulator
VPQPPRKQPGSPRRPSRAPGRPLPARELITEAHDRLRDLIVRGRLAPGAPIIETEVAALLGVRRSHLRAALLRLQHAGFVISSTIGTYSRSRVAPLTLGDVQELFAVIGALEGVAARNAAELPPRDRAQLVAALRRINRELRPNTRVTPTDYHDLDGEFHALYVTRAGGARVRMLYDAIKPQADRYALMYTYALFDQITISAAEHEAIIEAIDDGDADAAQRAADANWRNAAERFRSFMDVAGERGNAVPA